MLSNVSELRIDLTRNGPNKFEQDVIGVTANLAEGAHYVDAINELSTGLLQAFKMLNAPGTNSVATKTEVTAPTPKSSAVKSTPVETPKAKTEEPAVSEPKAPVSSEPELPIDTRNKEVKTEAKKEKVKVKGKNTPYDRTMDNHKKQLSKFLNASCPEWSNSTNLPKAGAASQALNGTDFLDGEGEVLQSFKDAFIEKLRA